MNQFDAAKAALSAAGRVLVAPHVNPDGDAVGSMAAVAHIVSQLGGEARLLLVEGVPKPLAWLPLPWRTTDRLGRWPDWTPDMVVTVDCGDARRAGPELENFFAGRNMPGPGWDKAASLCIDHHMGNPGFAKVNWVEPAMSSTGEMIGGLAERFGLSLAGELGQAVYLALVSDTGNFTYGNTSASCLGMAARIVENGLSVQDFSQRHENIWTIGRMHLWGKLMAGVTLHFGGQAASCVATQALLREFGAGKEDLEGFASWLRRIVGVRVGLFVRERTDGTAKISLRSMGDVDVRQVAVSFGGGGHKAASGTEVDLPPHAAEQAVLALVERALQKAG